MASNRWSPLNELEELVMGFLCSAGPATADDVRTFFMDRYPMKDSTLPTVLRRMETKGYLTHCVEGRTFWYRPVDPGRSVGARPVGQIADRLCNGSVEELLIGMVDGAMIDSDEFERPARRTAESTESERNTSY